MSFERDIESFTKDVLGGTEKAVRGAFIQGFGRIIKLTPVDTGRARGNWFTDINGTSSASTKETRKGAQRVREASAAAKRFKVGQSISVVNNLPYIIPLEDGYSSQAPSGMVKIVFSQLERLLYNQVRKLR